MIRKIKDKIKHRKLKKAQQKEQKKQIAANPNAYDQAVIAWFAPEYVSYHKGWVWKSLMILLVAGLAALGIKYDAWTFSLAVVVFALVYATVHFKKPNLVEVKLSDLGIKVGGRIYDYSNIKYFWINYEPPYVSNIHIGISGGFLDEVVIFMNTENPGAVRQFLVGKIPELKGQHEKFTDSFIRFLKL